MRNTDAHLVENPFSEKLEKASTRDGFGLGVVEAGKENEKVVVLSADLKESTRAEWFEKEFPERFIEVGVAEQHMATVAAGLAAVGKIPFITSYAAFSPGRNYEQIRTTAVLNELPVKVCGMHAGVSVGPDGATHQMLEDMGMMRMLPGMTVLNPIDREEGRKLTKLAAKLKGPTYLRFGRSDVPVVTTEHTPCEIGKALTLWEGERPQVTLCGTGALSYTALLAARVLEAEKISSVVLHFGTVKPLDTKAVEEALQKTGHLVTIEEHQIAGGFGSAIAEVVAEKGGGKVLRLGIEDQFGQSGTPEELLAHYGLDVRSIVEKTKAFLR